MLEVVDGCLAGEGPPCSRWVLSVVGGDVADVLGAVTGWVGQDVRDAGLHGGDRGAAATSYLNTALVTKLSNQIR